MGYRQNPGLEPLLIGYDPFYVIPKDHLCRLVDQVVDEAQLSCRPNYGPGQPAYDPRVCLKILIFSMCIGVHSSRAMQRHCEENLAYLLLTRGQQPPCYRTLCSFRVHNEQLLREVFEGVCAVALVHGVQRLGKLTIDSSKIRADASAELVVSQMDFERVDALFSHVIERISTQDQQEQEEPATRSQTGQPVKRLKTRDILRRLRAATAERDRRAAAKEKQQDPPSAAGPPAAHEAAAKEKQQDPPSAAGPPAAHEAAAKEKQQDPPSAAGPPAAEEAAAEEKQLQDPPAAASPPAAEELALLPEQAQQETSADAEPAPPALSARDAEVLAIFEEQGPVCVLPQTLRRLQSYRKALQQAKQEKLKHVSLTDPDARMMPVGRDRRVRHCHSFEVAVDNGLIVAANTTQSGPDASRLLPLVEAARGPDGTPPSSVTADSGYYSSEGLLELKKQGIDTCIPDSNTACDIRRGQPLGSSRTLYGSDMRFTYDAAADTFTCERGNVLCRVRVRRRVGSVSRIYAARHGSCQGCPLMARCSKSAELKQRTLSIPEEQADLREERERFAQPEHVARYHDRGPLVETVFAFACAVLGFRRWTLRGKTAVSSQGQLLRLAVQMRRLHKPWANAMRTAAAAATA